MTEFPIILDDLIEEELQNQIEDAMFDCNWNFRMDNGYEYDPKSMGMEYRKFLSPFEYDISPAIIANIYSPQNKKVFKLFYKIVQKSCDKIKFNIEKIERCYGAIHALISKESRRNNIHVNMGIPHLVMLYYVNDCDGDTILYDKTLEDIPDGILYPDKYHNLKITHRISPKKGRILFFDGRTYHSPSTPTKSMRCIITMDLFGKFTDGNHIFSAPESNPKNLFFDYK
jgi:hypothetical protein